MKIAKLAAGILLGVLTAYGCGGKYTQAGGSNTNWYTTCDSSSECGSGLTCWCGICTKACGDDCTAMAGATCSAPPPSCSNPAAAAKEKACAVQCTKDADCKDVGADATCVDSICRRQTPISLPAPLTCNQLTTMAQNELQPLRDGAAVACQSNADCTAFTGVSCTNHCSSTVITKTGLAAIQSHLDQIDRTVCNQFDAQGCTVIEPPCVFPGNPACVSGKCQNVLPGASQDAGTCNSEADHIHNTLLDKLDALDKSCKVDADCTRVQPELSCEYGCPVDVSTTAAAAFAATRSGLESDLCASYNAQGCRPVITGCPATLDPLRCLQGICTDSSPTPPDTDGGAPSCSDRTAQMQAQLKSTVDAADKKCAKSADCTSVMLTNSCLESCTFEPVSQTGGNSIQDELDAIDSTSCRAFTQAGCTPLRLPCPTTPTGSPACVSGTCSW